MANIKGGVSSLLASKQAGAADFFHHAVA